MLLLRHHQRHRGAYQIGRRVEEHPDAGDDVIGTGFPGRQLQCHSEQEDETQRSPTSPPDPGGQNMVPHSSSIQVQHSHLLARSWQKKLNWLRGSADIPKPSESPEQAVLPPTDSREAHSSCCVSIRERRASQTQTATPITASCSNGTVLRSSFQILSSCSSSCLALNLKKLPIYQPCSSSFPSYP